MMILGKSQEQPAMAIGRLDDIASCRAIVSELPKHERGHDFGGIIASRSVLEVLNMAGLRHFIGL